MAAAVRKHLAIALVAAAIILLQITVTRILSVVLWYHWAFFSISLAMLGVGAPGVWFALRPPRASLLPVLLLAATVAVPLGIAAVIGGTHAFGLYGIVFCLLVLLPAILTLGAAVCVLLLDARGAAIGARYASDLLGASAGAVVVVPAMAILPTPVLAAGIGLLPALALGILAPRRAFPAALAAAALLAVLVDGRAFALHHTKSYAEQGERTPLWVRWTPTARLAVFPQLAGDGGRAFRWGAGAGAAAPTAEQYWLEQDGSAGTPITRYAGDPARVEFLFDDVTSVGYQLRPLRRVAIVGAGGGRDVLTAVGAGAPSIDAIELNGAIVAALRGRFAAFSGGVYDLPGVRPIVGEGRSVLTGSAGDYDLIQISMIDSWAATAAGAFALSENNLYTVEAYRLYWARLSAHGMVATSRWMPSEIFGFEIVRLVLLVRAALEAEGIAAPERHIALVQGGDVGTLLMSRTPIDADLDRLRAVCDARGFALLYPGEGAAADVVRHGRPPPNTAGVVLDPPTDDRPFFFQALSPFAFDAAGRATSMGFNAASVVALRNLMVAMAAITLLVFFAPFAVVRLGARAPGFWRGSVFFTCIGLAFLFVEVAWLQRFVLYLGHPSLATTAALGCMLLGAGLGAMVSARIGVAGWRRWGWLTPVLLAALNAALAPLFTATLGWPLASRVAMTVAVLVPAAFTMGMFFPLGMVRFGAGSRAWFWALNGAAGVLAGVLSLALAMEIGFARVAYAGAAIYVVAWWSLRGTAAPAP